MVEENALSTHGPYTPHEWSCFPAYPWILTRLDRKETSRSRRWTCSDDIEREYEKLDVKSLKNGRGIVAADIRSVK